MKRFHIRTLLIVLLNTGMLLALTTVHSATAQVNRGRTVTVSGNGTVHMIPDQATVRFGIVYIDLDPETARAENARISALTMNSVRALGVEDNKIQVNVLRLQPYSEYDPDARRNVDRGFQAVRDVTVELTDLDLLPQLISTVVSEGANRIHGISYGLEKSDEAEQEALVKALTNAKAKAQLMVESLDARLGVVLQVNEQGVVAPTPPPILFEAMGARGVAKDEANPDAFASGEIEVSASVTVVFAILPKGSRRDE